MSDETWTETHRTRLEAMADVTRIDEDDRRAIDAALAEIARLTEERNQIEQESMEWCHAYQRLVEVVTGYDSGEDILKEAKSEAP